MTITVTELRALNNGDEICVTIDVSSGENKEIKKLIILASQYVSLRISKGEIDTEQFDEIARAAEIASAYKKGLYLLGYGACSEKRLKYKLKIKGFDEEISEEAVAMLASHGCINEGNDALREAEQCLSKLWGKKRIVAHLYSKGFGNEAVKEVIDALCEVDFSENCRKLIQRDYRRQLAVAREDRTAMAKLCASLQRMGYSFSEIREASEEITAD